MFPTQCPLRTALSHCDSAILRTAWAAPSVVTKESSFRNNQDIRHIIRAQSYKVFFNYKPKTGKKLQDSNRKLRSSIPANKP